MSTTVDAILRAAGWSPARRCAELEGWRRELDRRGVPLLPSAESALESYGGLRLENPQRRGRDFAPVAMQFDPMLVDLERLQIFEVELARKLSPLAEADGGNGALAIDASGNVFLLFEDHLHVGRSIDDALEHLLLGMRLSP